MQAIDERIVAVQRRRCGNGVTARGNGTLFRDGPNEQMVNGATPTGDGERVFVTVQRRRADFAK